MSLLEESYEPPLPPAPTEPQSPIQTYQLRKELGGIATEIAIQTFDDRILVLVSQSGKIGCLVQASLPAVAQLPHPPRPPTPNSDDASSSQPQITLPPPPEAISITLLLGTPPNPTLHALYTSQIATLIWWTLQETGAARRPVVVGLTLAKPPSTPKSGEAGDVDDEEGEVSEGERERFLAVMDMIIGWPGPGE